MSLRPPAEPAHDFNPLSPHGERRPIRDGQGAGRPISIHSPHTGRDGRGGQPPPPSFYFNPLSPHGERPPSKSPVNAARLFQSTLPTRGETYCIYEDVDSVGISIHSPHTGRDAVTAAAELITTPFQSTLPTRGETRQKAFTAYLFSISIHSPHTGRDG